jgi:hypothetical protein
VTTAARTPPARRADVQRVLSGSGLEYELLEHDDGRHACLSLHPARVDSAGCRQYAGVAMVQYAKLAAATAMMAHDEARSSHDGVDRLRRSRAWWVRHPGLVNRSALNIGGWHTRCANYD